MALDPLSGKPLWMREGIAPGTELFGDERSCMPSRPSPARRSCTAPSTVRFWGTGCFRRRRGCGSTPSVATSSPGRRTKAARCLSLRDPWLGQNLWSRSFDDAAQLTLVDLDEAAVLELSGKFTSSRSPTAV